MPTSAREEILARIQTATHRPGGSQTATIDDEWHQIQRDYKRATSLPAPELLHQLEDRLRDYDAGVYHSTPANLPALIAQILTERGKHLIAIAEGTPTAWLPSTIAFRTDTRADHAGIDACDGVLTSATLAIAETGTVLLQDAANGQGRRALTLLPDYHLCIVDQSTIVQAVPEAIARLQSTAHLATTFFSGPSATADIEMTRIKGVHGPRFVDVILLGPEPAPDQPQD
jgi:L-lactate dehydrogenase complex protein LldG